MPIITSSLQKKYCRMAATTPRINAPRGLYIFVLLLPIITPPAIMDEIKLLRSIFWSMVRERPTIVDTEPEIDIKVDKAP